MAYTKAQTARMAEFDSISFDQAVELGKELGVSTQSIISKANFMQIPYIKKAVPAKKEPQATKAEILEAIELALDAELPGLIGATREALVALQDYIAPDLAV